MKKKLNEEQPTHIPDIVYSASADSSVCGELKMRKTWDNKRHKIRSLFDHFAFVKDVGRIWDHLSIQQHKGGLFKVKSVLLFLFFVKRIC